MPNRRRLRHLPAVLVIILLSACSRHPRLSPFTTDGCSLFPDGDSQRGESWCECCVDHDYAYWKGGKDSERRAADSALGACVYRHTGDSVLADMVYAGTRAGGSGYFPTWYRWGYGWPYGAEAVPDSVRQREIGRQPPMDLQASARKACGEGGPAGSGGRRDSLQAGTGDSPGTKKGPAEAGP
ncbi:MAG: hypothetical protein JWP91_2813 [Fibrobacteres bacterium]|nr:hypothetical protein [Fibrobacterota bacterium]